MIPRPQWLQRVIPATREAEAGLQIGSQPGKHSETLSQNKETGDVAQWYIHLPSMHETLGSISNTRGENVYGCVYAYIHTYVCVCIYKMLP